MIDSMESGKDKMICTVDIRFRNSSEAVDIITRRSVRNVVVTHLDELDEHKTMYDADMSADCLLVSECHSIHFS